MGNLTDKEIKDFFQKREITPNSDSWDMLESMLDSPNVSATPNWKKWMTVAASLLIVGLLMWIVMPNRSEQLSEVYASESESTSIRKSEEVITKEDDSIKNETAISVNNESVIIKTSKPSEIFKNTKHTGSSIQKEAKIAPIAIIAVNKPLNISQKEESEVLQELVILDGNTDAKENIEIESLLSNAHERLRRERSQQIIKKHKIQPERLLAEAEKKSQETFLNRFKKNVQNTSEQVVVAVINRIYE